MVNPVNSSGSSQSIITQTGTTTTGNYTDESSTGGTHVFGSMTFTDEEWKTFLNNLVQTMMTDMRRMEKRAKESQKRIKESIEG